MSKDLDFKYFIVLSKEDIIFCCLNNENKISFTKKHTFINGISNLFKELENFFINNLIEIEKNLKNFIKKIYIIFDTDDSLSANLSVKYKHERDIINANKISNFLSYLKYQFSQYSNDQEVIHMTIIKLLIDGKEKDLSLVPETFRNLILEVKFECLKNQTVRSLKKLCSNYQLSVKKILIANHIRQNSKNKTQNLVLLANKILSGENKNEVFWISKKPVKKGFFEKFLNFFK